MTSEDIEERANYDQTAASDLDLQKALRLEVIPEFFADVKDVGWRRSTSTVTLVAGTKQYNLADDFYDMVEIYLPPANATSFSADTDRLPHIGEDANKVAAAEFSVTQGMPTGWYLTTRGGVSPVDYTYRAIKFNCPPDTGYTAYYVYLKGPYFTNWTDPFDMNRYCPPEFQPGIIQCLRKFIMKTRYSVKDPRYSVELDQYNKWLFNINRNRTKTKRGDRKVYMT